MYMTQPILKGHYRLKHQAYHCLKTAQDYHLYPSGVWSSVKDLEPYEAEDHKTTDLL